MIPLQIAMLFLMPLWLVLGRTFFGSGGWMILVYVFTVGPFVFVILLTNLLLRLRQTYSNNDRVLLYATYVSLFLHGFFLVDIGDTKDSASSAASELFGAQFTNTSNVLAVILFIISALLLLVVLGRAIWLASLRVRKRVSDYNVSHQPELPK